MRIGITGHTNLADDSIPLVADAVRAALIGKATTVRTMPFPESGRYAYMAASEYVLDHVDAMVAVWDGGPSGGYGGTADVVDAARARSLPVTVVWPSGARRD